MAGTLHLVEIDIFQIPFRPCRQYQEKIADYYLSGRPRFEWEKMRQKLLIEGNRAIEQVCSGCRLNLMNEAEGCKIRVESVTSFMAMVGQVRPESKLVSFTFNDDLLDTDETRMLYDEIEYLAEELKERTWPVAQVMDGGMPRRNESGIRQTVFYEWVGGEAETFIYSNPGYTVAISSEGLVVRESLGADLPERFQRLWKDGASVYGETQGGRIMPFLPIEDQLPAWDESGMFTETSLQFTEAPALDVYGDVVESLLVYAQAAIEHNVGLKISLVS